jgi:nucleoside-diphosphate-sugar epimerase
MTNKQHVVIGATGGAGSAITAALTAAGLEAITVGRHGTIDRRADIETPGGARTAVEGAAVVYMAAQPPYTEWSGRFPAMLANVIDATADVGAKLVMVDNLYGYGPVDGPLREDTPEQAADAKGRTRRTMTAMLMEAHRSGRLPVTIGRAADYFGPNADNSAITSLAIAPAAAGKRARWIGRLDMAHSAAYLPDIARAFVTLGTEARADGKIWHLPHAQAVTGRRFTELMNASLGEPVGVGALSKTMLRMAAPFNGMSRETLALFHQWNRPFVVDDGAFRSAFGPVVETPLDQAIHATVGWYRSRHMVGAAS